MSELASEPSTLSELASGPSTLSGLPSGPSVPRAGFQVDEDELDAHAGTADRVAERLGAAAGAARPLDLAAYGMLGQLFAAAAVDAAHAGSQVVADLSRDAAALAAGVRACREAYRDVDRRAAAGFEP